VGAAAARGPPRRGPPPPILRAVAEGPSDALSFDLLAASIRADAADLHTFLEVLASKLESALPGRVTVRRRAGLLTRRRPVESLAVSLGGRSYQLHRQGQAVAARVAHHARGIVLRIQEQPVEAAVAALWPALAEHRSAS